MTIVREEIEDTLAKVLHKGNTDFNMGVLATLYHLTDAEEEGAEETFDELTTAMVYQQTIKYEKQTLELSGLTRAVASKLQISEEQLQVSAKKVQEYVAAEQQRRQEAANETQSEVPS